MLAFQQANGKVAIPMSDFEILQQKNLKSIKHDGLGMVEFNRLTTYNPDVRFKNVMRKNEDGTFDVVIDASVYDEISSGFLPKRAYKALRFKKNSKMLSTSVYSDFNIISVSSSDIISQFKDSLTVDEIETLLIESIKKGKVNYFG
ncbi:MAG: hypothetical protein [Caudoviricetes sp.]|nr:MAG: hypothetical protein [Caudoviricetes sp.]